MYPDQDEGARREGDLKGSSGRSGLTWLEQKRQGNPLLCLFCFRKLFYAVPEESRSKFSSRKCSALRLLRKAILHRRLLTIITWRARKSVFGSGWFRKLSHASGRVGDWYLQLSPAGVVGIEPLFCGDVAEFCRFTEIQQFA